MKFDKKLYIYTLTPVMSEATLELTYTIIFEKMICIKGN